MAVPPDSAALSTARVEMSAVQLAASVASDVSAAMNTEGVAAAFAPGSDAPAPAAVAAATEVETTLTALATAVAAIAVAPLWYLGLPVTLPLSILGGITLISLVNLFPIGFGAGGQLDPLTIGLTGSVIGLGFYAFGPLGLAAGALSSLLSPSTAGYAYAVETPPTAAGRTAEPSAAAPAMAAEMGYQAEIAAPETGGPAPVDVADQENAAPAGTSDLSALRAAAVSGDDAAPTPAATEARDSVVTDAVPGPAADVVEAVGRAAATRGVDRQDCPDTDSRRGR